MPAAKPAALPAKALEALARKHGVSGKGTKRQVLRRIGQKISPTFDERLHLGSGKAPPTGSFVVDSFTDTAGTLLKEHKGETGATWAPNEAWGGVGTKYKVEAGGVINSSATDALYASGAPAGAEYAIAADYECFGDANTPGSLIGRMSVAAQTGYRLWYRAAVVKEWRLEKYVAGALTQLAAYAAEDNGKKRALVLNLANSKKAVFIDGVERLSSTDNTITAAGKVGVYQLFGTVTSGARIDNLTATDAAPTGRSRRRMIV